MRILGVDYAKNEELLTICVAESYDGYVRVVKVDHIKNVPNREQAKDLCMKLCKKFNCNEILLEDNFIDKR